MVHSALPVDLRLAKTIAFFRGDALDSSSVVGSMRNEVHQNEVPDTLTDISGKYHYKLKVWGLPIFPCFFMQWHCVDRFLNYVLSCGRDDSPRDRRMSV